MPDGPPSPIASDTSVGGSQNLNPLDIERVLTDFRAWLEALRTFEPYYAIPAANEQHPQVDLATLVGQFVALKQEVNLQTRASRGQMEQNAQALEQLRQSLALIEGRQDESDQENRRDETLRPLLKTLVDVYDALALARREVQKISENLQLLLPQAESAPPAPDRPAAPLIEVRIPWWARFLGLGKRIDEALSPVRSWNQQEHLAAGNRQSVLTQEQEEQRQRTLALLLRVWQGVQSILTGYSMSLQRLERALEQYDLEAIPAAGEVFDPEFMEALEVVRDTGRPPGEVTEEIRRGYLWHGKVFRFAQVKVSQ